MIIEKIGEAATWEGLAEEATELAQAALKCARLLRNENPVMGSVPVLKHSVIEELSDLTIYLQELGMEADPDIVDAKRQRFLARWKAAKE